MPNSRRNRSNRGFLGRLYAPVNRGLQAFGEVGHEGASTVGNVFGRTVSGVRRVGSTVTGRLNQGVGELVRGKSRRGGRRNNAMTMRRNRNRRNRSERSRRNRKNRSNRNRR